MVGNETHTLLSWGVGIADLEKKPLITNSLAMEGLDDLLADIAGLEASESNTTAVALGIVENSAGDDSVVHEDCSKLGLVHVLWQVGDVEVGRALVTLGLETGVERLSGEADLVAELVETTDAQFGVTNIVVLGETKSLASTGGGVNDSLRGLNTSKASSISSKCLIIDIRVKTTDVDVAIAVNWVGQALLKSSHVLAWSEDSWNCWWDGWLLLKEGINIDVLSNVLVGDALHSVSLLSIWSWRWSRVKRRSIVAGNNGTMVAMTQAVEWGAWSRLVGGVGTTSVVEAWDVLVHRLMAIAHVALAIWHHAVSWWEIAWVRSLWSIDTWWIGESSIWELSGTESLWLKDIALWHIHDLSIHVEVLSVTWVHRWSCWLDVTIWNVQMGLSQRTDQSRHSVLGQGTLSLSIALSLSLSLSLSLLGGVHAGRTLVVLRSNLSLLVRHGPG